jgi:hypothetical protein
MSFFIGWLHRKEEEQKKIADIVSGSKANRGSLCPIFAHLFRYFIGPLLESGSSRETNALLFDPDEKIRLRRMGGICFKVRPDFEKLQQSRS